MGRRRLVDRGVHGVAREHEDVDLSLLACDVPAFRAHLGDAWTPWSNHGGTLRPLNDWFPEPFDAESQIWLRRDASSPWAVDLPITPDRRFLRPKDEQDLEADAAAADRGPAGLAA